MKILVIGDQHTTGYGLPAGQVGFVGHFVRQISRAGQAVTAETHPSTRLTDVQALLSQLPLENYDLIIWQCGEGCWPGPAKPTGRLAAVGTWIRQRFFFGSAGAVGVPENTVELMAVLQRLRPHRHKVLIMTPAPTPNRYLYPWCEQGRQVLLRQGQQQDFSVFDTSRHVRPTPEYFLDRLPAFMNAVAHELVGRALFDFYQATPTIVAIRSVRKN